VLKVSASNSDGAFLHNKCDKHCSLKFKVIIFIVNIFIVNKMYIIRIIYSKVFSNVFSYHPYR